MKIKNAGFDVSLNGDNFRITPASFLSTRQREFLKLHKAEIINELQAETIARQTEVDNFVSCADCLHFKCNNSHGKGGGYCLVGSDYGLWSETQHHCTRFDARVEWVELPEPKPNTIMVICYSPNGNAISMEAKDEAHAIWLQKMNSEPQGKIK